MKVFQSGASRTETKPAYHIIPYSALRREAQRFADGAAQHGEFNFMNGATDREFQVQIIDHAIDHLLRYKDGIDPEDDHLAAVRCGMAMLIEFEERGYVKAGELGVPSCAPSSQPGPYS